LCPKCKLKKPLDNFFNNKSRSDGKSALCKLCGNNATKKWQQMNRTEYIRSCKKRQVEYVTSWKPIFEKLYGLPVCQICKKMKKWPWEPGKSSDTICFDHRVPNSPIKDIPSIWIRKHPATDKHIKTFISCNFGLLCKRCNVMLPNENRVEWAKNVLAYSDLSV
jgi:hypothetical protein